MIPNSVLSINRLMFLFRPTDTICFML